MKVEQKHDIRIACRCNITSMKHVKIVLTLAIGCTAFIGDFIVFQSQYAQKAAFRAVCDDLVHASIGFLSSLLFLSYESNLTNYACFCNVAFCTVMSSIAIDIDHAFVAKSIYLKDMKNLKKRGIFHCSSLWLLLTSTMLIYSHIAQKLNIYILSWMLIIAYTSHHIRDGNRRGLWVYPFGHTPAIPKYLYVILVSVLPHMFAYFYKYLKPISRHTIVNYDDSKLIA